MKKQQEKPKKEINIFLKEDWTIEDYKNNNQELLKIGMEYKKCYEIAENDISWKENKKIKRKFASDYFQIRNGGMTEDLKVISDGSFELNSAKLDKYFKWVEFSKTEWEKEDDKKIHKERFDIIKNLINSIKLST